MKKKLYIINAILVSVAMLCLSSCLKDPRLLDFSKGGTVVNFSLGGLTNFGSDAITETPDTDAKGTIVRQFAIDVASPTVPTTSTTVKMAIDTTLVAQYNSTESAITYLAMPSNAYSFTVNSATIPAGQRTAIVSVTFYKNLLDPSKSYMLPIKITGTSQGIISGNLSIHYYHFIGNDFAGAYEAYFTRWPVPDTSGTPDHNHVDDGQVIFAPVDPGTFKVPSGYYTGIPYTVTFTKTGTGSSATYSNFAVTFTAADITTYFTNPGQGVVLGVPPVFDPAPDPAKQYTFSEALKLFRFYYLTGTRAVIDQYVKQ